ncbi:MAG: hypothetical protein ACXWD8_17040, partial [Mycobacterium sp.]
LLLAYFGGGGGTGEPVRVIPYLCSYSYARRRSVLLLAVVSFPPDLLAVFSALAVGAVSASAPLPTRWRRGRPRRSDARAQRW